MEGSPADAGGMKVVFNRPFVSRGFGQVIVEQRVVYEGILWTKIHCII